MFSGVCETDLTEDPPIFNPVKACLKDAKSTYYSSLSSSSSSFAFYYLIPSLKNSSSSISPPKKSGRFSLLANYSKFYSSSPIITTLSSIFSSIKGVILLQMVSNSIGVFTKTSLANIFGKYFCAFTMIFLIQSRIRLDASCIIFPLRSTIHTICSFYCNSSSLRCRRR